LYTSRLYIYWGDNVTPQTLQTFLDTEEDRAKPIYALVLKVSNKIPNYSTWLKKPHSEKKINGA